MEILNGNKNVTQNIFLFDWISFSSQIHGPEELIHELGLDDLEWQIIPGHKGYKDRFYYDSISIHYNGREGMGVWCEMSGQGCRVFETFGHGNYLRIFQLAENNWGIHFTRVDIALDDHEDLLDIQRLFDDTVKGNFVSKFKSHTYHGGTGGLSVEHGRKGSRTMMRIYDKAAERGYNDGKHWIRIEIQLRDERAEEFIKRYLFDSEKGLSVIFLGVLRNYIRYVVPDPDDSNRRRWPTADYWDRLISSVTRIRLFVDLGIDYNMRKLEDYVIMQAGNAIDAYIEIVGEKLFKERLKNRTVKRNMKYQYLVARHAEYKKLTEI